MVEIPVYETEKLSIVTDPKTMKPILGHISLIMDTFVSDKFIYTAEQGAPIIF